MKSTFSHSLSLIALVAAGLAGCTHKNDAKPTAGGLVGSWKLTNRQCYCVPAPTPDETVTFTNTSFSFFKNGQLTSNGTYTGTTVIPSCGGGPSAGLRFSSAGSTREAVLTLTGNTLTLDYGGPCDAPVDTYEPLP